MERDYSQGQQTAPNRHLNNLAQPTPTPQPIPNALNGLDSATARLHEALSMLESRLGFILASLPPSGIAETGAKVSRHTLAIQIGCASDSVNAAADRIDSMMARLEL